MINNGRKITNFIYNHGWLLAQMRQYWVKTLFDWELQGLLPIILLLTIFLKKGLIWKKTFMSDEWAQHKLNWTEIGWDLEQLLFDHAYWDIEANIVSLYEPLYMVLRLMDSEVVLIMSFGYELMHVMKENLIRQETRDWIFKIIKDRWEKTLKHPLHVVLKYYLSL